MNKYGQDVLHQYLLEADVGDIIIIKSDFPHNEVASKTNGTILFAYEDNPNIRRSTFRDENSVYVLTNDRMDNGRRSLKICIKGKLEGNVVIDAELNDTVEENDQELLGLGTVMNKVDIQLVTVKEI